MSRPFGSGLAVSKSIRASAASMGRDFLYPMAFIWRFSLGEAATQDGLLLPLLAARLELQGSRENATDGEAESGQNRPGHGPPSLLFTTREAYIRPTIPGNP